MNSRSVAWLVGSIFAALLVIGWVVGLRSFVMNVYRVPTSGMYPTIRPDNIVWNYRLAYSTASDVRRGDLVVFRTMPRDGKTEVRVQRVIGLPGDRVRTAGRWVYLNSVELVQTPSGTDGLVSLFSEQLDGEIHQIALDLSHPRVKIPSADLTVPGNAFFLLGDNRTNSFDSRYTGCITWSQVIGKIVFIM